MIISATGWQIRVDNRIRILEMIYSFDIEGSGGGVARFASALSQTLDPKVFDVTICGLWNTGIETEQQHIQDLNSQGFKAFTAATWDAYHPYQSLWKSYQGLQTFIQQYPVDIIHSHSEFSDIVTLMLKFYPGVPIIMRTLHNGSQVEWRKRYLRRILLTYFLNPLFFNLEVGVAKHVVTNMDRRWLAKLLGHYAILVHNAINVRKFDGINHLTDKSRLGLDISKDSFVVGTVGRLREEKGYNILLEAAAQIIHESNDPIKFMIIGTGELADALKAQAQNLQIANHVIFTGPRSDIEFLLSGMDLFVCSSFWEGFSTAILEAMAAKVPVLATDIPGNRELIEPGVNGWMVPSHNAPVLAREILNIYYLPEVKRQTLTDQALIVAQLYSIDAVAVQYQLIYHELFEKQKK
jgi:glycosyltransferase involved in cell wall biosynthesis